MRFRYADILTPLKSAEMYWNIEKEYSGKYSESRTVECR